MGEKGMEGSGALKERLCKFSLTSWYILKLSCANIMYCVSLSGCDCLPLLLLLT